MSLKRLSFMVLMLTALFAQNAFSQAAGKKPADILVGKCVTSPASMCDDAQVTSIRTAIDNAKPGYIIEILDVDTYEEGQIVIGADKIGITIRSVNPTSRNKPVIRYRDTINVHPKNITEAQTGCAFDPQKPGQPYDPNGLLCSGNFQTNGAISFQGAKSVTLDGITIDGGSPYPFGWAGVWGGAYPLFHGSAGVAISTSGNITIRNCDIRNAYYGIAVKDRNIEGAFSTQNKDDIDDPILLGSFGDQGGHLIEYNRIYNNSGGYYSESAWDLGSTIRYNLFYNNFHTAATNALLTAIGNNASGPDKVGGAIVFKDHHLSPIAIYNNTFFSNAGHITYKMQARGHHLVFNNIFSKFNIGMGQSNPVDGNRNLEPWLANRMYANVMSAYNSIQSQKQNYQPISYGPPLNPPGGCIPTEVTFVQGVQIGMNGFGNPPTTSQTFTSTNGCTLNNQNAVNPGAPIVGGTNGNLRWLQTEGYIGNGLALPELFQSVDPNDPDFLRPIWTHQQVMDFIKNKGWNMGPFNSDGTRADLGAIPSASGRPPIVARATPSNVIMITPTAAGNIATIKFQLDALNAITGFPANLTDVKIQLLRWIAPLDSAKPAEADSVPSGYIRNIPSAVGTSVKMGSNEIPINVGAAPNGKFGFFEMILEGKDASGNTVVSDVAFFPFTTIKYELKVEVLNKGCGGTALTEVMVGDAHCVRVTAYVAGTNYGTQYMGSIDRIKFSLFTNNRSSTLWSSITDEPFTEDNNAFSGGQKTWDNLYFKTAGDEQIKAAGIYYIDAKNGEAFLGIGNVKVRNGMPDRVEFLSPRPKETLKDSTGQYGVAQRINPGEVYNVEVLVLDTYGNPIDSDEPVELKITGEHSSQGGTNCVGQILNSAGNPVASSTVSTDPNTGIATFKVRVGSCGVQNDWFDMTATMTLNGKTDVGRLRVGQSQDRIYIFFSDNQTRRDSVDLYFDESVGIDELGGVKVPVYIKAVSGGSKSVMDSAFWVCVSSSDSRIEFYEDNGAAAGDRITGPVIIKLNNPLAGEGVVWITANEEVVNASIEASAVMNDYDCDALNMVINTAYPRENVNFKGRNSNIKHGAVFAENNGDGRPDMMIVVFDGPELTDADRFGAGWETIPDSVTLMWPNPTIGREVKVGRKLLASGEMSIDTLPTAEDPERRSLKVIITTESTVGGILHEDGYTGVLGSVNRLGALRWNGGASSSTDSTDWKWDEDYKFDVVDSMSPIISKSGDIFPDALTGRKGPLVSDFTSSERDTLMIQISEELAIGQENALAALLAGSSILTKKAGPLGVGAPVKVIKVERLSGWVNLILDGLRLIEEGDSVKFNADSTSFADGRGNVVKANNRWVEVGLKPAAPIIDPALSFYINDPVPAVGGVVDLVNRMEVKFNKAVDVSLFNTLRIDLPGGENVSAKVSDILVLGAIDVSNAALGRISINLPAAFNAAGFNTKVRNTTGGTMSLTITYDTSNGISKEWGNTIGNIGDKASPVLANIGTPDDKDYQGAVLKSGSPKSIGGGFDPDTLVITYSEELSNNFAMNEAPLAFWHKDNIIDFGNPVLEYLTSRRSGRHFEVRYLVPETGFFTGPNTYLTKDDSVSIYFGVEEGAQLRDLSDNRQDKPNKKIPIRIEQDPKWSVKIKNNPFKATNSGRNSATVVFSPGVKTVSNNLKITVNVLLFDQMGNLVLKDKISKSGLGEVEWVWRGHNRRGRLVGSGTYHMKAEMKVESSDSGLNSSTTEVRAIGFVR